MQNFPHQISELEKLYSALKVIDALVHESDNIGDDEVLGIALAKSGVYSFRGSQTLEEALIKEKAKPRANRGTETAARDLRRLFLLMGLLLKQDAAPSAYLLTSAGKDLLAAAAGPHRSAHWRAAMLGLTLETAPGSFSHPYQILVRLVSATPGIEKQKLLLALEAKDDSEGEFNRVVGLAKLSFAQVVKKLQVSKSGADNAIKILPSIAQQLGDVIENKKKMCFPVAVAITTEEGSVLVTLEQPPIPTASSLAEVDPDNIATIPAFADGVSAIVDLADAIALRKKRTIDHNRAVRSLARLLKMSKFKLYEYPYDCLAIDVKKRSVLVEVKTLDGSPADERQQAERALGQLKGYRHFSVPNEYKDPLIDLAAFTKRPSKSTIKFLQASGIHTTWEEGVTWKMLDKSGNLVDFNPASLF